jgi:hypothetical protein
MLDAITMTLLSRSQMNTWDTIQRTYTRYATTVDLIMNCMTDIGYI